VKFAGRNVAYNASQRRKEGRDEEKMPYKKALVKDPGVPLSPVYQECSTDFEEKSEKGGKTSVRKG